MAEVKDAAAAAVDRHLDELVALSHFVHEHPELCYGETVSSHAVAEALRAGGLEVREGVYDLDTAFESRAGTGELVIAVCAEYDALPEIGHACGHNVIAAAAVGAGLARAPLASSLGLRVEVLGTPAEEGGGGKIIMLERGVFDGIHAAMMVHPFPDELVQMPCLAVSHFTVHYSGKAAHASAFPELGVNAADALTVAQVAIGLLRQHASPGDQVHGIVTNGGAAPNVVPARASGRFYVRSRDLDRLATWEPKIRRCFVAGALASGAGLEMIDESPRYSEFRTDEAIAARYRANAEALGRSFTAPGERPLTASTDMANVSLAIPAIHPTLGLGSAPVVNHQPEFAAFCATPVADKAMLDGAAAMAWTVIDLATGEVERERLLGGWSAAADA
ncbi:MAG TPA: M20 family metallopeptidase [Acidimicrobiales bacterium]|nr:M20 family metallopeptidase [Acidimicrobiales bacterium]